MIVFRSMIQSDATARLFYCDGLVNFQSLCREGNLGTVRIDDLKYLEQHRFLDRVVLHPVRGFGKRVDEKIQGGRAKIVKIDDQGPILGDVRMVLQHVAHGCDDSCGSHVSMDVRVPFAQL